VKDVILHIYIDQLKLTSLTGFIIIKCDL